MKKKIITTILAASCLFSSLPSQAGVILKENVVEYDFYDFDESQSATAGYKIATGFENLSQLSHHTEGDITFVRMSSTGVQSTTEKTPYLHIPVNDGDGITYTEGKKIAVEVKFRTDTEVVVANGDWVPDARLQLKYNLPDNLTELTTLTNTDSDGYTKTYNVAHNDCNLWGAEGATFRVADGYVTAARQTSMAYTNVPFEANVWYIAKAYIDPADKTVDYEFVNCATGSTYKKEGYEAYFELGTKLESLAIANFKNPIANADFDYVKVYEYSEREVLEYSWDNDFEKVSKSDFTITDENNFQFISGQAKSGLFSVLTRNGAYSVPVETEAGEKYFVSVSWKEKTPGLGTTLSLTANGESINSYTREDGDWKITTAVYTAQSDSISFSTAISSGEEYYIDDYAVEKIISQKIDIDGPKTVLKGDSADFIPVIITKSGKKLALLGYDYTLTLTGTDESTLTGTTLTVSETEEATSLNITLEIEDIGVEISKEVEVIDETGAYGVSELYVAVNGSDENSGTVDAPLATLEAARDRIRTQGVANGGTTVYIRGGTYYRNQVFVLTSADSGTEENPVIYKAYQDEVPVFTQGIDISLSNAQKVTDTDILSRLPDDNAKEHLYSIDLSQFGIEELTPANYPGAYTANINSWINKLKGNTLGIPEPTISSAPTAATNEVFFEGAPLTVARYPNGDDWIYMKEGELIDEGAIPRFWEDDYVGYAGHVPQDERDINDCFTFTYTDRVDRWTEASDALMFGFWYHNWATQTVGIGSIDTEANTITSDMPSYFGVRDDFSSDNFAKYYVYNLIEELDCKGEYYFDRENLILYFYRSDDMTDSKNITVGKGNASFISISGASYVTIEGIELTAGRSTGITINADNVTVKDCVIHNLASSAIYATGKNNLVDGCNISNVDGGVTISSAGSYQNGFVPGNSKVQNCTITNFARISRVYTNAISLSGVENAALNNEISDAYHMAIGVGGYDNLIQGNEIYDVCKFANDAAAIYNGRNWLTRGNSIIGNYIHDIHPDPLWAKTIGVNAVFADDLQANVIIKGNIFENIDGYAVKFNGGYDHVVENNTFINCARRGMIPGGSVRIGRYSAGADTADDYVLAVGCVEQLNGLVNSGYFNDCWKDDPHSIHETKTVGGVSNVDVVPIENFALFIKSDEWGENEQENISKYINKEWHERYPEVYEYLRYHGGDTYGNVFRNNVLIDTDAAGTTNMTDERFLEEDNLMNGTKALLSSGEYRSLNYNSLQNQYKGVQVSSEYMGINGAAAAGVNPQGIIVNDDCTTIDGFTNYNNAYGSITTGEEDGVSYVRLSPVTEENGNKITKFIPSGARNSIKISLGNKKVKFEQGKPITIEVKFRAKSDKNSYVLLGNNAGSTVSYAGSTPVAEALNKNHNILSGVAHWNPYTSFLQVKGVVGDQSALDWSKTIAPTTNLLDGETWFTLTTTYDKLANTSSSTLSWGDTLITMSSTNLGYMTTKEYLEDIFIMNQSEMAQYIEIDYLKVKVNDSVVFENDGSNSDWETVSGGTIVGKITSKDYAAMFYDLSDENILFKSDEIITIDTRVRYCSNKTKDSASEGPYMLLTLNMPEDFERVNAYKLLTQNGTEQAYSAPGGYRSTLVAFANKYYAYINGYQSNASAANIRWIANNSIPSLNQFTPWMRVVIEIDKLSGIANYRFYNEDGTLFTNFTENGIDAELANIPVNDYLDNIGFSQMNPDWGNVIIDVDYLKISID